MPMLLHKHKGARSELLACAWLLAQGYDVFRNVSQHGRVDIVAIKSGVVTYLDVKTCTPRMKADGHGPLGHYPQEHTILPPGPGMLLVFPDGTCRIKLPPDGLTMP